MQKSVMNKTQKMLPLIPTFNNPLVLITIHACAYCAPLTGYIGSAVVHIYHNILGKWLCTKFQWVNVAASVQCKHVTSQVLQACGPKSQAPMGTYPGNYSIYRTPCNYLNYNR